MEKWLKEGKGVYSSPNGVYEGEFMHGNFEGSGICRLSNGRVFDGEFFQGIVNGNAIYKYPNGTGYHGFWKDNELICKGGYMHAEGVKNIEEFADGQKIKEFVYHFKTQTIAHSDLL